MIDYKLLKEHNINPKSFKKVKSVIFINDEYVLKRNNNSDIFSYLEARGFSYFPSNRILSNEYVLYDYLKDYDISDDERAIEVINLISLLHNKTTRYINTSIDDYKRVYEDISNKIDSLYNYYNDLNELIDQEIYMAPSSYLLARNISKIYSSLNYCKNELDSWYDLVKGNKKERIVLIHNNLSLEHLIRNDNSYLISWDKSRFDSPIYDLYNFYRNNYDKIEFSSLFSLYNKRYLLKDDEIKLFFILISLPDKIEFSNNSFSNTKKVDKMLDYLYKTDNIISPYYSKDEEEKE